MNFRPNLRWKIGIPVLLVVLLTGGAFGVVVVNNIPDAQGVIHACFKKQNGQLRVVESSSECLPSEDSLTWEQGQPVVSGFVFGDGSKFGNGFTVTKLGAGHFELRFPTAIFSNHPAVGVSGWGIPGQAPIVNVFFNDFDNGSYRAQVLVRAADGVTPIESGFQFVAAQVR